MRTIELDMRMNMLNETANMTSKSNVIHNLASEEIHSVMSAKDLNINSRSKVVFLSPKAQKYREVKYKNDQAKYLKSSVDELEKTYETYADMSTARDVAAQDNAWQGAMQLHNVLTSSDTRLLRHVQKKFIYNVYEYFLKLESKRCISRPNFINCMTKLFDQTSSDESSCEKDMCFDELYDKFDVLGNGLFNWRRFLFYLHVVSNPTLNSRQQLLHAFLYIGSHDGIDNTTSAKASIDIHDIGVLLFPLVRTDAMDKVVSLMDEAWSNVSSLGNSNGDQLVPRKITMDIFERMLDQKIFTCLLGPSSSKWGKFQSFPVPMSQWEENFYNTRLLQLVREQRINVSIRDKLERDGTKMKHLIWREWQTYTTHRRSMRSILSSIDVSAIKRLKRRGLTVFANWSAMCWAALTLQRVSRGHLGRNIASVHQKIKQSAIIIQCCTRMYFAKKKLQIFSASYLWGVVTIQRIVRGAIARSLAFKRLMSLVEQEHIRNMKERDRLLMLRGVWGLTKLQSCIRRINAKRRGCELRAMRKREADIRHAMEARCEKFRKERRVYERQLEEFYRCRREEFCRNIQVQSKVTRDKVSVRTLHRRIENDERKNASADNSELMYTEQWKRSWEMKIEAGVEDLRQHCLHCLKNPDNRAEKKVSVQVKKRIKIRTKEVLKRADSRGIPMETKEATKIATDEVLHIIGEEERERLQSEMNMAFQEREKNTEEARLNAEAKRLEDKDRATVFAVSVVAGACRRWLARNELRRRCLEMYEKDYDENTHRFYYRNKETYETSWDKPKAMGSFEMPTKDEWKILRDAHNFPYYYNPFSMQMQWNPPLDKSMCSRKVPHYWYREFPVRFGACPNFSINGNSYCSECLDAMQKHGELTS